MSSSGSAGWTCVRDILRQGRRRGPTAGPLRLSHHPRCPRRPFAARGSRVPVPPVASRRAAVASRPAARRPSRPSSDQGRTPVSSPPATDRPSTRPTIQPGIAPGVRPGVRPSAVDLSSAGDRSSTRAAPDPAVLEEVARRVLWLATRIVDAANRERDTADGVKVGGHQSSSASLVTAMTALWFAHLDRGDRVSVKPHASPVFHAIQYLLGNLDESYLTTLRSRGGLQSYPSRTKDPDRAYIDFSTGSVGLGAAAPLFAALTRHYVDDHFGARPRSRFVALLGDAELD